MMIESQRYRIAMVAACPFPTCQGSQVLVKQTAEALARAGHQVHLVCYHFGEEVPLETSGRLVIHRIAYPSFLYRKFRAGPSIQKPLLDGLMVCLLLKVMRQHDIQVIHAHNYEALVVGFSARLINRTPVVFHTHNAISEELSSFFHSRRARQLADRAGRFIDGKLPRRADHVIAINSTLQRFFLGHGVEAKRLTCLSPGIVQENWTARPLEAGSVEEAALAALDRWLDGERTVALYAGNLDDYQNLPLMFRAFARVREQLPRARLVIVSRSDPAPYRMMASELGLEDAVFFVDHTRFELARIVFSRCRAALLPRISWGGFPIKLLNYMAAGLPVVASKGSAKIVTQEKTGLVVEDGDEAGFAAATVHLLSDPEIATAMGKAGRNVVETKHTWDAHTDRLEEIYSELI